MVPDHNENDDHRPRGLLAPVDRAYLLGEKEYDSPQARYKRREAITERVTNGLLDSHILVDHLDADGRQRIVEGFGPDRQGYGGKEYTDALQATVALVYQLARAGTLDAEAVIKDGMKQGEGGRLDALENRLAQDPASLTLGEIEELAGAGRIDRDRLKELITQATSPSVGFVDPDEGVPWDEVVDDGDPE